MTDTRVTESLDDWPGEAPGTVPGVVFADWQVTIDSWNAVQDHLGQLFGAHDRKMLWRGAHDSDWGVFSSLYRSLRDELGHAPTEGQMTRAEKEIFKIARRDWRYDNMPGMELLAQLQHFGAPTRLLDVTYNPMVALWFAVQNLDDNVDARLFAFAHPQDVVSLKNDWSGRNVPWIGWKGDAERAANEWGTGRRRMVWRPPTYNPRIMAQNAAFLLDGVPFDFKKLDINDERPWAVNGLTLDEWKQVSSMSFRLSRIEQVLPNERSAPAFTFVIRAEAKAEIRALLQDRYGYRASTIYADMSGLAAFVSADMSRIGDTVRQSLAR